MKLDEILGIGLVIVAGGFVVIVVTISIIGLMV